MASSYQITTVGNASTQTDFEETKSGLFHELWLSKFSDKKKSLTKTNGEGSQIAVESTFTLYIDYNSAINMEDYKSCKLIWTNFFVRKMKMAFAFPKDSPYLSVINTRLQSMFESGEVSKIIEKHSSENPSCQPSKGMPLGFDNIAIVFLIMAAGLFASIILCGTENILSRKTKGKF